MPFQQKCPVCGDATPKEFKARVCLSPRKDYDLVQCGGCGLVYFAPMPDLDEIRAFYSKVCWGAEDGTRQIGKGAAFARVYLSHLGKGKKILDVGCASGCFLSGIRDMTGWNCYGIELNPEQVRYGRQQLNLDIHEGALESAHFEPGFFDYIHLRDIIEHVTDPLSCLAACRRLLKPDGRIYLSIPNGDIDRIGLTEFHTQEKTAALSPNGHLFFFGRKALLKALDTAGFEVESSATYGIKQGLRALRLWPRKNRWIRGFDPNKLEQAAAPTDTAPKPRKKRSLIYHVMQMWVHRGSMLPGLWSFGLDYELILKPKA